MSSELTNIEKGAIVPDYLKDEQFQGKQGFEDVKPEDLVLARLAICQDLTPQHKRTNPKYISGLEVGQLFNTVSEEIFGEKVEFIPLKKSTSRIYFKDIKEGGGVLCRSFNGIDGGQLSDTCAACDKSAWGEKQKPPACTEFMNFPVLLLPRLEPIGASFKSTAMTAASTWLTKMQYKSIRYNVPMYVQVWEMATKIQTRATNEYFGPVFSFKRFATREEAEYAQKQFAYIQTRRVVVHEEGQEEAEVDERTPF